MTTREEQVVEDIKAILANWRAGFMTHEQAIVAIRKVVLEPPIKP